MSNQHRCDVAIIGAGPAGTTAAGLIRKYNPNLNVLIVEKEQFPRDHVGESQLPPIGAILEELGCWDEVEGAGFPIKVGATYRWGDSDKLWDFNFVPPDDFTDAPRPAPYEGIRRRTALQVDRARYDEILLRHAETLGCHVLEQTAVKQIIHQGKRVSALELSDGSSVESKWYIDASGNSGILRRALGIDVHYPSNLKNIAMWDYWDNATWADEIGVGGTRVQVLSQSHGWMWFIPLGPTRTSIGLITPVEYYKQSGKSTEELYAAAVQGDELVSKLTMGATRRGELETTSDWSYLADESVGENWFLIGEAAGFADPILAAGMTLAHSSARECAYSILELERGELEPSWIKENLNNNQLLRIRQHIRFADFWYAANGQFSDLKEHCQTIARDSGLELTAEEAWQWIAQGGFNSNVPGQVVVAGFLDMASAKKCVEMFTDGDVSWNCDQQNVFRLKMEGAVETKVAIYQEGRIHETPCLKRDGKLLPVTGFNELIIKALTKSPHIETILPLVLASVAKQPEYRNAYLRYALQALEHMVDSGWVDASHDPSRSTLNIGNAQNSKFIQVRN